MLHRITLLALAVSLGACVAPSAPSVGPCEVIPLQHASAQEVAADLQRVLARPDGPAARVTADQRTNSLIVVGDTAPVREMVVALDREVQ